VIEPSAPKAGHVTAAISGHILVVDDNENNRDLLSRRLERQGHTTLQAADGAAAIKALEADKDGIDLVLLDIMMPVMDGYQVLETIKSREDLRDVPVIMISALTEMDSVVKCIQRGAVDYLSKPFNAVLLKARVDSCLEKKQLRDQERRAFVALRESQARLATELAEASAYVQSLLPKPISGDIATDWQSIPSAELGGDLFGYRDLDADRFALYLFDVSGHGVGAALLSVSVANALRSESIDVDFADPAAVLGALNNAFPMEKNNEMYFTAWYGVYARSTRELVYARAATRRRCSSRRRRRARRPSGSRRQA
jgi:sigma-B regulation protein RsbU (phosphoserine phosphatase)